MSMARIRFAQGALILAGVIDVFAGLALIAAPRWFFDTVAPFEPFNRHFLGDAGTFLLPVGGGMLMAARDPLRHRLTFGVGAGLSILHALNHIYDAIAGGEGLGHWLRDTVPLIVLAIVLAAAFVLTAGEAKQTK